jgi:DNA polymerase III subunit beta
MNIIIDKNLILTPLSKLVSITEKRSLMPILSNVLMEFGKDRMTIFSTDLEVSAIGYIDYQSASEKKVVVHGRRFLEILKEMDNGDIELNVEENSLTIKQKKTEIVLSLQDPEEFPEVKEIKGYEEFDLDGHSLLEMIDKVGFAISMDETRFILTGMYMKGLEGRMVVVGTDGFRMAQYQKDIEGLKGFKGITIPKRSVSELERVISEEDTVKLRIDEKHVQFSTKAVTVVSRIIEGNFPDYENVVPTNNNTVVIEKEAFLRGLKKVSTIIGKSEPVKVDFNSGNMEIEAVSDMGHAKETMNIEYEGETISMNFNVRFLLDVVSHTEGTKITMKAPATYGAVLFEGEQGETYRNIVMPIRV